MAATSALRKSRAEMLTDTDTSSGQLRHSAVAVASTQRLISEMRPVSSAIGMNSEGAQVLGSAAGLLVAARREVHVNPSAEHAVVSGLDLAVADEE